MESGSPNSEVQQAYEYSLAHFSGIGARSALILISRFPTVDSWLALSVPDRIQAISRIGKNIPTTFSQSLDELFEKARQDIRDHEKNGIRVFTISDHLYPALLKRISNPPLALFVRGEINHLSDGKNAAVVGTRNATKAGEKVAEKIARWLGENDWCVVSGLAKGIDTAAHRGSLESSRSKTVAVMATPLKQVYPAENKQLANRILENGGGWLSEVPLWKKTHRNAFVERDRIQSGVSVAVIPVQTDVEGGTMHTIRYAEEQGRLVLCPQPIQLEQSLPQYAGIWNLIKNKRASQFSGEEYNSVLETLLRHRDTLMHQTEQSDNAAPNHVTESHPVERSRRESRVPKHNQFQLTFGTGENDGSRLDTLPGARTEIQLSLLESLFEEFINYEKPDGSRLSNFEEMRIWLRSKIRDLRNPQS